MKPVNPSARIGEKTSQDSHRQEALARTLSAIEKKYGKGVVQVLGETPRERVQVIPTGSLSLDIALGVGGYPRGRIVEIYGHESSGKTTLALHAIAEVHRQNGTAAFIDAEHALDTEYARRIGIHVDNLIIVQPDYGEQALEVAEMLMQSGAVDLVVIDSVPALVPRAELEGAMGEIQVGLQARLMSQALRRLLATIKSTGALCIFINQVREKIGVTFGNSETTPGGRALRFYASVQIDVRKIGQLKEGENVQGIRVRARVVKNKVAPPHRHAEFDILFNEGISREGELIDLGVQYEIISKSGSWYSYGSHRLGQGKENARQFLKEHPRIAEEIREKILRKALPHLFETSEA